MQRNRAHKPIGMEPVIGSGRKWPTSQPWMTLNFRWKAKHLVDQPKIPYHCHLEVEFDLSMLRRDTAHRWLAIDRGERSVQPI